MSGLLERIARRRRALSEPQPQTLSDAERHALPVGDDGSAGSPPSVNGNHTNGADPIGHFVDLALLPGTDRDPEATDRDPEATAHDSAPAPAAVDEPSEAPTTDFGAIELDQAIAPDDAHADAPVDQPDAPDIGERAQLRRRARYLRRLREIQLRDIGGLLVELHRFRRERPDLVQAKVTTAAETATELREIEAVLSEGRSLRELREAGIGGACEVCGAVHGSRDRFCAACGERLDLGSHAPASSSETAEGAPGSPIPTETEPPPAFAREPAQLEQPAQLDEPELLGPREDIEPAAVEHEHEEQEAAEPPS